MLDGINASWSWIVANAAVVSAITSVGMLLIWGVYLQLMLYNFRKQRRSQIVINRSRGSDINALCLISNMSSEVVFLEGLIARLETSRGTWYSDITDILDKEGHSSNRRGESGTDINDVTRQGPMESGGFMEAGTFGGLIQQIAREQGIQLDDSYRSKDRDVELRSIEILAVGIFGSENGPIGARRKFLIKPSGDEEHLRLVPEKRITQQMRSFKQRRRVQRWQDAVQ